jgi:sugar/nucleoside kinase (ribokinase family)
MAFLRLSRVLEKELSDARSASRDGEKSAWISTYHLPSSDKVVDTTGAGNAVLGGAALAYLKHKYFTLAVAHSSVTASFVDETIDCQVSDKVIRWHGWGSICTA